MSELLEGIASIETFPTVDEIHDFARRLAVDHPDRASVATIGQSRGGDEILLLTVEPAASCGSVLVVGMPHPNEPIGMAAIMVMAQRLASDPDEADRLGATWHFVPCADPDGTRLNEGWFRGPFTREHYARNFYRPGPEQQVEWTFPFETEGFSVNAPMPETRALMTAIEQTRPDVLASLHNAEMGGAYYYVSPGADELYPRLTALCDNHNVPLHRGEAETPLSVELAPAVYSKISTKSLYEYAVEIGLDPSLIVTGASSFDHALTFGRTFGLVIELPYWRDARAADTSEDESGKTRRDVVLRSLDIHEETAATLRRLVEGAPPSPFANAIRSFLAIDEGGWIRGRREEAQTSSDYDRPATVAEAFSAADGVHLFRLRLGGMLLRALPEHIPAHEEAEQVFAGWVADAAADDKAEPIPIRDLVAVQAGAVLATARHVIA